MDECLRHQRCGDQPTVETGLEVFTMALTIPGMKKGFLFFLLIVFYIILPAQERPETDSASKEMYFVSDTQQPMFLEKLFLKSDQKRSSKKNFCDAYINKK